MNEVDGFEVHITEPPAHSDLKLWFINLGGYREGRFGEVHKCILVTAPDLASALN